MNPAIPPSPPPLHISVLFHSYFRELTGCAQADESVPPGTTLGELQERIIARFPRLAGLKKSTLMAVGLDYQDRSYPLQNNDEVSFFPPVQGG